MGPASQHRETGMWTARPLVPWEQPTAHTRGVVGTVLRTPGCPATTTLWVVTRGLFKETEVPWRGTTVTLRWATGQVYQNWGRVGVALPGQGPLAEPQGWQTPGRVHQGEAGRGFRTARPCCQFAEGLLLGLSLPTGTERAQEDQGGAEER